MRSNFPFFMFLLFVVFGTYGCKDDDLEDCVETFEISEKLSNSVEVLRNTKNFTYVRERKGSFDTITFTRTQIVDDSILMFPNPERRVCSGGGITIITYKTERFNYVSNDGEYNLDFHAVQARYRAFVFVNLRGYLMDHGESGFFGNSNDTMIHYNSSMYKAYYFYDGLLPWSSWGPEACFGHSGDLNPDDNATKGEAQAYFSLDHGLVLARLFQGSDSLEIWRLQ